jgi:peptidoglycan lytic transglycosylase
MPIKQNSSSTGTRSGFGLSSHEHGAIASAIAPLMVIFVNVAAPRPANAQCSKDTKAERSALLAPQPAMLALAGRDLPPVIRLAARDVRIDALHNAGATPRLQAVLAALRPAPTNPAPPLMHEPIVGIASTYNPCCPGMPIEGAETASGETYDADGWTAAIQTGLRGRFGGVRYGTSYRPAFALVESDDKRLIVKINDVGPLAPGRVIDLNERAMRFFDATLERGLLPDVRITPLDGGHWTPGPVDGDDAVVVAMAPERPVHEEPVQQEFAHQEFMPEAPVDDEPVREQVAINLN